ncbi:MAG: hypothetical protein LBN97_01135 [Oscillospiraceae bacterium]|jgi:hypothetical protein|nr:hypothetical protein [Oscillospiraceae bacterium]
MSKKILALALTLAMILTLGSGAFAATVAELEGHSTIYSPTLNVVVPSNLNFALSPLGAKAISGNQIANTGYVTINRGQTPVQIKFDLRVIPAEGVTLATSAAQVPTAIGDVSKVIQFGIIGATAIADLDDPDAGLNTAAVIAQATDVHVTAQVTAYALDLANTAKESSFVTAAASVASALVAAASAYAVYPSAYSTAATDTIVTPAATAAPNLISVGFALKALDVGLWGTNSSDPTFEDGGESLISMFQFYGKLNANAVWAADDVRVRGTYTLSAIGDDAYTTLTDGKVGNNQLAQTVVTAPKPGFVNTATGLTLTSSPTYTYSKATDIPITFDFITGGFAITEIKLIATGTPLTSTEYKIVGNTITLYKSKLAGVSDGPKTGSITLQDGSTYVLNVVIGD